MIALANPIAKIAEDRRVLHLPQQQFPSLAGGVEWLNSEPLTPAGLRGKVVLVDFWTYTCVNWLRTLPYVRAWNDKYKSDGFVVIGVHTPEFGFEHDIDNVRREIRVMDVTYPVVTDNNYAIWNAFGNEYWPAEYLIDANGAIRYHHFGEGAYADTEREIQRLLAEAGHKRGNGVVSVDPRGLEVAADYDDLRSPENFLGADRTTGFASPGVLVVNAAHRYAFPRSLQLNEWALSGDWTSTREAVALNEAGGRLAYRFHGRDLNLVMGSRKPGAPARFRVLVDGKPPGSAHGIDVDADGNGLVNEQRTYQLIRHPKPIIDRTFEIEFLDPDVETFDFTFG